MSELIAGKFTARFHPSTGLIVVGNGGDVVGLKPVPGVRALIDPTIKADFVAWLDSQTIKAAAVTLGVGPSTVWRLRKALGLTTPQTGQSRWTVWRKQKKRAGGEP